MEDASLLGPVGELVAKELSLEKPNRLLTRNVIREALQSQSLEEFQKGLVKHGSFSADVAQAIHSKVATSASSASAAQLRAQEERAPGAAPAGRQVAPAAAGVGGDVQGFASAVERLEDSEPIRGGLQGAGERIGYFFHARNLLAMSLGLAGASKSAAGREAWGKDGELGGWVAKGECRKCWKAPEVLKGLDALARAKRVAEAEGAPAGGYLAGSGGPFKRPKVAITSVAASNGAPGDGAQDDAEVGGREDEDDGGGVEDGGLGRKGGRGHAAEEGEERRRRHYRGTRPQDTPSHPGGVNEEAAAAIAERDRKKLAAAVNPPASPSFPAEAPLRASTARAAQDAPPAGVTGGQEGDRDRSGGGGGDRHRGREDRGDARDTRDSRDSRVSRDGREARDPRDPRDSRDVREGRESRGGERGRDGYINRDRDRGRDRERERERERGGGDRSERRTPHDGDRSNARGRGGYEYDSTPSRTPGSGRPRERDRHGGEWQHNSSSNSWEWEDTPRRETGEWDRPTPSRRDSQMPSPSPARSFIPPSPADSRLPSPWESPYLRDGGGSSWDMASPSPAAVRAGSGRGRGPGRGGVAGGGGRAAGGQRSHQLRFRSSGLPPVRENEDGDARAPGGEGQEALDDDLVREMENAELEADRSWYDAEEGGAVFDADGPAPFLGDEAMFKKREAELQKHMVRRDGKLMSLAQSKKLSQLSSDNAQWEDRQLMRSGVVRSLEHSTDVDDEEEERVLLLVHDTKPPFLDGRVVYTKQQEPVMPLKDPTSDMAIIARKGSAVAREVVRENQVVVVVGETGSGKTTQMTQYLLEDGYATYGMVGCTQPRRVAAMSVAKRVSEELDCELGTTVGYAIRFEDVTGPSTLIKGPPHSRR
eukprot:jgi/Mesen1/6117/ME000311S05210